TRACRVHTRVNANYFLTCPYSRKMLPRFGNDDDCSSLNRIEVDGNVQRTVFSSRKFSPLFSSSLSGGPYFCISVVLSVSKSCAPASGGELGSPKKDHSRTKLIF